MELETTGENAEFILDRTDGAHGVFVAKANHVRIGSTSSSPFKLIVGGGVKMNLKTDGSLVMASGATCTAGGIWTDASSLEFKENIKNLTADEAINVVEGLNPVKYNSKMSKEEKHVGFIAEEVPDLVATNNRKGLSPMDIVAVLTKVVQEQQRTISKLQERIAVLEKKMKSEK